MGLGQQSSFTKNASFLKEVDFMINANLHWMIIRVRGTPFDDSLHTALVSYYTAV